VGFEHLDRDGQVIPYVFSQMYNDGPVAFGWLRASHRELDEARSTPQQPIHLHQRRQYLVHRTPVAVDIEVWPTSLVLRPGETLRLVVQGSDLHKAPGSPMASRMGPLINDGHHTIHTGGAYDSHLLIPVIPATDEE
jgi:predicted acyl esterase